MTGGRPGGRASGQGEGGAFARAVFAAYFTLRPAELPRPLLADVPVAAWAARDPSVPRLQRSLTDQFRVSLHRVARVDADPSTPLALGPATEDWAALCDGCRDLGALPLARRCWILGTLQALCYQRYARLLAERLPEPDAAEPGATAYLVQLASLLHHASRAQGRAVALWLAVDRAAAPADPAGYSAAMSLLVNGAKYGAAAALAPAEARHRAAARLDAVLDATGPDWQRRLLRSHFLRGASFVPFLAGDLDGARRELQLAAELATRPAADEPVGEPDGPVPPGRFLDEARYFALESLMRLHLAAGDLNAARDAARAAVDLDPYDARARYEFAEAHLRLGDDAAALRELRLARVLAPPGLGLVSFALGHVRAGMGDTDGARADLLASLHEDPYGESAAAALADGPGAGGPLAAWAAWRDGRLAAAREG